MLNALTRETMGSAALFGAAWQERVSLQEASRAPGSVGGAAPREPEFQSPGGLWPLFALAAVLVLALGVFAVLRQRSRRRASQDRALLEGSLLSGFPSAPPEPASQRIAPGAPGPAPSPPVSNRMAAVVADDRAARSGRPLSVPPSAPPASLAVPPSERQWQSQRPRGLKDTH